MPPAPRPCLWFRNAIGTRMSASAADAQPVVIVGGGFGGLSAALALSHQQPRPPIVLIEPNDRFVFLPLLYELLSGELQTWEVAPRYAQLLDNRGIVRLQERARRIDTVTGTVETDSGVCLAYGQLVLASGSEPQDFGIPGVREHALQFHTLSDVARLRNHLRQLQRQPRNNGVDRPGVALVIVGAGATGVELACKMADLLEGAAELHLIERGDSILPLAKAFNREQASLALQRRGVHVHLNQSVQSVQADSVTLQDPNTPPLKHNGLIWTAGTRPRVPELIPNPQCRGERLLVDASLCSLTSPNLVVIGDVAAHDNADGTAGDWPRTAQVALQQGEAAARTVMAIRARVQAPPFQYNDLGEMMSLGKGEASLTGLGLTLAGPLAYRLRRLTYLARLPGLSLGLRAAGAWLLGG